MASQNKIAIIGAGFSGSSVSIALSRQLPNSKIYLIHKGEDIHRGLAYGTKSPSHLLNVPSSRMSILNDSPTHFVDWLKRNNHNANPDNFTPRIVFGTYIEDSFKEYARGVTVIDDLATGIEENREGFSVNFQSREELKINQVVLCCGWGVSDEENKTRRTFSNTYKLPSSLPDGDSAIIIGSGLTAVDCVLSLREKGFKGKINMISRRGLLPKVHSLKDPLEKSLPTSMKLRPLLRYLRTNILRRAENNLSWHGLIDAIRPMSQNYWRNFTNNEKSAFLRHLRPYWGAHRHRIAEEISNLINVEIKLGSLSVSRAKILEINENSSEVQIKLRFRGSMDISELKAAFLVNASGAEVFSEGKSSLLYESLIKLGKVKRDIFSLGVNCTPVGEVYDSNDKIVEGLFAAGPPTRGSLWESTAVPEIAKQASDIANAIVKLNLSSKS
jgi:uncharacterized NAD(P)/FAD-binding protein YdhS